MTGSKFDMWITNSFLLNGNSAMNMGTLQKISLKTKVLEKR
jgi:hypothetical protein